MISAGPREAGDASFRLREVRPADSGDLYLWRMDPESRLMFRSVEEVSRETHARFLARYFRPLNRDQWFVIEADGHAVGAIALYGLSSDGSEAEWGRLVVAPGSRGNGYGKRALALLVEHAREIGVRSLRCEVVAGNGAAEAIYDALGFRETGREEIEDRTFRYLVRELS